MDFSLNILLKKKKKIVAYICVLFSKFLITNLLNSIFFQSKSVFFFTLKNLSWIGMGYGGNKDSYVT